MKAAAAAGLLGHLAESAFACWAAGTEWTATAGRPVDGLRWLELVADRRPPRWSTPNRVVFETPIARLRDFSQGSPIGGAPTLLLPPQAGHASSIVDFSPEQSQVRTLRSIGLSRLWCLDWVGATPATKHSTVDDYLAVIDRASDAIGSPLHLIGDCQGGWLAAIWAALRPERVESLTLAGAPIDFHAGDAVIGDYVALLHPSFYRAVVALGGGLLEGRFILNGFIGIRPENELGKQLRLLANLDDRSHVERYGAFEDWYKHTQNIAGPFYLWIVEHLFRRNSLVEARLEIGRERVELGHIRCPLRLLAGAEDHITPPAQVFAMEAAASSRRVIRRTSSGGHLGLFMGREALRDQWPRLLSDVARPRRPRRSR
jgi:poly(3-hydroxybutyrate) depolymerase